MKPGAKGAGKALSGSRGTGATRSLRSAPATVAAAASSAENGSAETSSTRVSVAASRNEAILEDKEDIDLQKVLNGTQRLGTKLNGHRRTC